MRLRPLAFALLAAGLAAPAGAADLMTAYELARQSDPQLAIAEANAAAAEAAVTQARSALLPQVNGQASLTDQKGDSTSIGTQPDPANPGQVVFGQSLGTADTRTRSVGINVQQSLFDRSDYTRLDAAQARAAQAEAQRVAAEQTLGVRVATAYFDVLTAIESLASARAQEAATKRQLDQADTRLEVGLAPITDVFEARASFDGARANAISSATRLDDAREALIELTGVPLEGLRGLAEGYQPKLDEVEGLQAWVDRAQANNPSLLAAARALEAAQQNVATARAGHLPTLALGGGWNDTSTWGTRGSGNFNFPATGRNDGYNVGITLTVPIFSGFATQAAVRQALANRDVAADQLEQQRRGIVRQTRNAYRSMASGAAEVEARRLAVVSARAALEAGEAGLEVGTRTIVDVLLGQQNLFAAQTAFASARHAFLVNELALKQAAGELDPGDIEAVNRLLTVDAEALLDQTK